MFEPETMKGRMNANILDQMTLNGKMKSSMFNVQTKSSMHNYWQYRYNHRLLFVKHKSSSKNIKFTYNHYLITSDNQKLDSPVEDNRQEDSPVEDNLREDKAELGEVDIHKVVVAHRAVDEDIQQWGDMADQAETSAEQGGLSLAVNQTHHLACPFQSCVVSAIFHKKTDKL